MPRSCTFARALCVVPALAAAAVLTTATMAGAAGTSAGTLAAELERLSVAHGFAVEGTERLAGAAAPQAASGDLRARLRTLLAGHDHVVEDGPQGVRRVIVLGASSSRPPPLLAVPTTRAHGGQHLVQAEIEGPSRQPLEVSLLVDTGASSIVLPESLVSALGFNAEDLAITHSQTANGTAIGRSGTLDRVRVGAAVREDVAVLFVPDERLGGIKLLGMSFLSGFAVRIDAAARRLLLEPRDARGASRSAPARRSSSATIGR